MKRRRLPKYVSAFRDRHGKSWYRFRRKGYASYYFKTELWSDAFTAEYQACMAGSAAPKLKPGQGRAAPGSLSALIAAYYGSAEYQQLADSTKQTYRNILERFRAEHGDKSVMNLQRPHVKAILAKKANTPSAANNLLKLISILMKFALAMDWRKDDPTAGIKPMKTPEGGFYVWTEADVEAYEATHPVGSMARLAMALMLFTGQRRSDAHRMGWQHVSDGWISVVQQKSRGKTRLEIPLHPELAALLADTPRTNMTFILNANNRPFKSAASFGNRMRDWCDAAGLPECTSHGLRHLAAGRLAEAGATAHQIMAITGHKSLKEVERYTRKASQKRLAQAALLKLQGTAREQELSNLENGLDNSASNILKKQGS